MIKAIETSYNGYRFRSRLEARWAVFLDAIGIRYEYEQQGYHTAVGGYLPDFWLPEWECYVEIKPTLKLTEEEIIKAMYVALEHRIVILCGNVDAPVLRNGKFISGAAAICFGQPMTSANGELVRASGKKMLKDFRCPVRWAEYNGDAWAIAEIPVYGMFVNSIAVHVASDTPVSMDGRPHLWHQHTNGHFELWPYPEFAPKNKNTISFLKNPAKHMRKQQSVLKVDTPALQAAYESARSARFEFGETPKTLRGKPKK